jgi:DNA-binding transcriptional LysR family regulator
MELTPEGEHLLPLTVAALDALEALDRAAGVPLAGEAEIRVGSGDALGRELLPGALRVVLREFPGTGVKIVEGSGRSLFGALVRGEIDVALVAAPAGVAPDASIEVDPCIRSQVDLLLPGNHRLRGRSRLSLRSLSDERLVVLHRGSSFRRHLEEQFARVGVPFRPAVEVGSFSLVRRYVAAGLGVAPVPEVAFRGNGAGRSVLRRRLGGVPPLFYRQATRRGVPLPAPTRRLLTVLARGGSGSRAGSSRGRS